VGFPHPSFKGNHDTQWADFPGFKTLRFLLPLPLVPKEECIYKLSAKKVQSASFETLCEEIKKFMAFKKPHLLRVHL